MSNKCLQQVNNFRYLDCEILYKNKKDIQQKLAKFAQILGILKNTLQTNFRPEIFRNKSKKCSGSPYSFIKKLRGLSPRANYTDRAAAAGRRS